MNEKNGSHSQTFTSTLIYFSIPHMDTGIHLVQEEAQDNVTLLADSKHPEILLWVLIFCSFPDFKFPPDVSMAPTSPVIQG